MKQGYLCTIYFDEHLSPTVHEIFSYMHFRCISIARTKKYAGRDEKDYIHELAAENAIFVTADMEFVNYVVRNNIKHAGIVLLPTGWEIGTLTFASAGVAGSLRGLIERNGRSYINNKIYYIADDGYHKIENGRDVLEYSIAKFEQDVEEYGQKRPGL